MSKRLAICTSTPALLVTPSTRLPPRCDEGLSQAHTASSEIERHKQRQKEHQVFGQRNPGLAQQLTANAVDALKVSAKAVKKKQYRNIVGGISEDRYGPMNTPVSRRHPPVPSRGGCRRCPVAPPG